MSEADWAPGDLSGLRIPAHAQALREGGPDFLTAAFRSAGALPSDNAVLGITQFEECPGGSTGRKLLLSVAYAKPAAGLHTDLFVKFSRDFDDPIRDRGKVQMESEVRLAALSRAPEFPIAAPACYFADYEAATGTGILITQRVAFDVDGVEPHYEKCLDYMLPEPLAHYEALIKAIGTLAGTHKAGRLPAQAAAQFPFEPDKLDVGARAPYTVEQVQARVSRYAEFAEQFPQLLPANIASPEFIARLMDGAPHIPAQEAAIKQFLTRQAPYIALCHWNANIDNAWFWRNGEGVLECGLMDWGHVSQMNLAMALWGALCAAEISLWDDHLDHLLAQFVDAFRKAGGPPLDVAALELQLDLYCAIMGVGWMLDAPVLIRARTRDLENAASRFDPRIAESERSRNQLQIMSVFMNRWDKRDFNGLLDRWRRGDHGLA